MPIPFIGGTATATLPAMIAGYVKVLYRRKWLALAVFLTVVGAVGWYTYKAVPLYESQVTIVIGQDEPNIANVQRVLGESNNSNVQTEIELLRSRALVQQTVAALKMSQRPEFKVRSDDAAVSAVIANLVAEPRRGTRLVDMRIQWTRPDLAAEIANAHARGYLQRSFEIRRAASKDATDQLQPQLKEAQARMEQADSNLQRYRERNDAMSLAEGQNIVVDSVRELNGAVNRATQVRIEKQGRWEEISPIRTDRNALEAVPAIRANQSIQTIKTELGRVKQEELVASKKYGPDHQTMIALRQGVAELERRLDVEFTTFVSAVRNEYQQALADEQRLSRDLDARKREATALESRRVDHDALKAVAEGERTAYQRVQARVTETQLATKINTTNIAIIDDARPSPIPVWPRPRFNMVMSIATGLLLAVGAVFIVEVLDDRIKTAHDLSEMLGRRLIGAIPKIKSKKGKRISIAQDAPPALRESFRALRAAVIASDVLTEPRSLLVASSTDGEGKTHIACNLAISLAQAQFRVLLVDVDLRRPNVHAHFNEALEPGLSNVLSGSASLKDALRATSVPGLTVLTGGPPSAHAPELLGSAVFGELFGVLEEHFDWVILDSPPTLTVADARVVAQCTKGVVFVTAAGKTRARGARLAIEELQRAGGVIIGTVLNRAESERDSPYVAVDYSGDYSSAAYRSDRDQATASTRTIL